MQQAVAAVTNHSTKQVITNCAPSLLSRRRSSRSVSLHRRKIKMDQRRGERQYELQ